MSADASENGYGAVLEQEINGTRRINAYYSKSYTKAQHNYATCEKELLAIVMAVEHWHGYLYGEKFHIFSDHKPLKYLLEKKVPHPRLERWMLRLAIYQFEIEYTPGKDNIIADALSRFEPNSTNVEEDYLDVLVAQITETAEIVEDSENEHIEKHETEQDEDADLCWIKQLLRGHTKKPAMTKFANTTQRILYKEFDNFQIINNIINFNLSN